MKCEKAMAIYLENEKKFSIPISVKWHIMFCPVCSAEISRLMAILKMLEKETIWKTEENITGFVMDRIMQKRVYYEKRVSGVKWMAIGAVIISSILLINFSNSFIWFRDYFGFGFVVPMSIVLGLAITAYMVFLTLSNYDYLEKYLHYIYKDKEKY